MRRIALWLTGIPASGKSTIAFGLARRLGTGNPAHVLESDEIRQNVHPSLRYDESDRELFYSSLGYIASLLAANDVVPIIAATGNRAVYRDCARRRLPELVEVYVKCPVAVCAQRDPKGLYAAAARGDVVTLPVYIPERLDSAGIYEADRRFVREKLAGWREYEFPTDPLSTVDTSTAGVEECVEAIMESCGLC